MVAIASFFPGLLIIVLISVIGKTCGRPNFVLIFADDTGYGDFQCYGHPTQERGAIDDLADGGMRFTQWYSAASLCTPSRAALLTGRLPIRSGIVGPQRVFWSLMSGGLPKSEITIAEALKEHGYVTGIVGKWHLGINEFKSDDWNHLPKHHGFDYVKSLLPFSFHWTCDPKKYTPEQMSKKCFLHDGESIIEQPINLDTLTEKIRESAIEFIQKNQNESFFLYMPVVQTHSSLFCSPHMCNKSRRGLYGDNVNEMAWAVQGVVETLKSLMLENNTLVLFLSDHGPQPELCNHGGSTGGLKGGKASTWDGGIRVPAIAWWPGTVPARVVNHEVVSTLDVFPTILDFAGGNTEVYLDGKSLKSVLKGQHRSGAPVHDILFHYCSDTIMAVRIGRYKLHYYTQQPKPLSIPSCSFGAPRGDILTYWNCSHSTTHDPPLIFDMNVDPGEQYPLDSSEHQDLIREASKKMEEHRKTIIPVPSQFGELDSSLQVCCNPPACQCNYNPEPGINKDEL